MPTSPTRVVAVHGVPVLCLRVTYAFAETGPQQLWSVKPDGSDKKQLTECEGISNWPTVTPDGETRRVFQ